MSMPAAGTYVIYNRVLSPAGDKLAITFNGQSQAATVTPQTGAQNQQWQIVNYSDGKTQSLTPVAAGSLQAAWGSGFVTVSPAGAYVWTVRSSASGYTIQDGGVTVFWGVNSAVSGSDVSIGSGTGNEKQNWLLQKV